MLLKKQSVLQTPVGTFSEEYKTEDSQAREAKFYKRLIPLSKPNIDEQYAFKVDLDKCTGCKACVSACHNLNGLESNETWRDVGTIHGAYSTGESYTQTVTTACHHCADPGCLNGCPVLAYEKDETTGIVRHLDDQCIGCQYCVLKCPYDVPKYSKSLGIVRKCDMCHSRLSEGEAPACVQACPTEAISITIVNTQDSKSSAARETFLPTAPKPSYTIPTTQYVSNRTLPENIEAGDTHTLKTEEGHFPLVLMLVLTQLSVGLFGISIFADPSLKNGLNTSGFIFLVLGLFASVTHLGRPLGAWRSFLGLRRSWLSREIVLFGAFFKLTAAQTAFVYFGIYSDFTNTILAPTTFFVGLLGVISSVMIYHDTRRPFWTFPITASKFLGSTTILSLALFAVLSAKLESKPESVMTALFVVILFKLLIDCITLLQAKAKTTSPIKKTALLMLKHLKLSTISRFSLSLLSLFLFSFFDSLIANIPVLTLAFICLLTSEIIERSIFFRAVVAPKMPGGAST